MGGRPTRVLAAALLTPLVLGSCGVLGGGDDTAAVTATTPRQPAPTTTAPGTVATDAPSAGGGGETQTDEPRTDDGDDGPLEITLAATGDILTHSRVNVTANRNAGGGEGDYDYTPMYAEVAPLLGAADLTLCHMETPLSPDNTNLSVPDVLVFNTPHQMADALAGAGVDGCDFASNHTMDLGLGGLEDTEQVIRDAGMGYAGPTAHEDRAGVAQVYDVPADGGVAQVAHLAYTYTYPNSGTPTTSIPGEAPWLVAASWPSIGSVGILEQAGAARDEGADFVVVSMHWGNEYQSAPTPEQTQLAADLLGSDAVDLVLGTHVHVIQPCERINGKHVVYGLGNFLSNQSPDVASGLLPQTQEGMVAQFTLRRDEDGVVTTEMTYQPTRVDIRPWDLETGPHVIQLVTPENYPQTWERTTTTVNSLGGCGAEPVQP
ncbi:CapA family protein [Ornithinimicrobium cerasi]|uniref:Poly-gamma-glutamate synthesis protein (Capsule biosynthesis protein) n=1 Tax=Ornithinimicrobium cerasi TaxID=2248773 RepID=A0A285VR59_9MICO|nr:CapA family protein [Ornithinimicrobium cerasi]SOC55091.1 poly-gamma-glutamate synthesis protein (capsule biosynthesis protein) [Ornithinimicrobium cerasi]